MIYLIVPKPFYIRAKYDRCTLACFSLLFPCLGGLADRSLREACARTPSGSCGLVRLIFARTFVTQYYVGMACMLPTHRWSTTRYQSNTQAYPEWRCTTPPDTECFSYEGGSSGGH